MESHSDASDCTAGVGLHAKSHMLQCTYKRGSRHTAAAPGREGRPISSQFIKKARGGGEVGGRKGRGGITHANKLKRQPLDALPCLTIPPARCLGNGPRRERRQ